MDHTYQSTDHRKSVASILDQREYIIDQSTYFIEYFMEGKFKYPRIKKIHYILEKITRFDQKSQNPFVLLSHELLSTKIHYVSIYIFYILIISRQVQKSKNYENQRSTSKVTYKTIFIILFKLFSNLFEFKVTREVQLI